MGFPVIAVLQCNCSDSLKTTVVFCCLEWQQIPGFRLEPWTKIKIRKGMVLNSWRFYRHYFFKSHFSQSWIFCGDPSRCGSYMSSPTMQYFGGKLSAAQLHVAGWVGGVRRSFQGALALVWSTAEEDKEENKGGNGNGRLQKAVLPLRSFAHHNRRSMRHFSIRSQQTVPKSSTETCSVRAALVTHHTVL